MIQVQVGDNDSVQPRNAKRLQVFRAGEASFQRLRKAAARVHQQAEGPFSQPFQQRAVTVAHIKKTDDQLFFIGG